MGSSKSRWIWLLLIIGIALLYYFTHSEKRTGPTNTPPGAPAGTEPRQAVPQQPAPSQPAPPQPEPSQAMPTALPVPAQPADTTSDASSEPEIQVNARRDEPIKRSHRVAAPARSAKPARKNPHPGTAGDETPPPEGTVFFDEKDGG